MRLVGYSENCVSYYSDDVFIEHNGDNIKMPPLGDVISECQKMLENLLPNMNAEVMEFDISFGNNSSFVPGPNDSDNRSFLHLDVSL